MRADPSSRRPAADFIILSAMRSGSGNLQDALSEHPEIDCGAEVFNPTHLQIRGHLYQEARAPRWARLAGAGVFMAMARRARRRFPDVMLHVARSPRGKRMFGFRLFGDHISFFRLDRFLDDLHARGTRFVHLVRRDTFDQALSLVRAQTTGVWKITSAAPTRVARLDLPALADRVQIAAELLHGHKLVTSAVARRHRAMRLDYDEYTRDERSYDGIQKFLGVRALAALRHVNRKSPPVDADAYRRLREALDRRGAPMRFDPDAR
jgi:hypothetical protein